jgi:hypothetical protein
MPAEFLNKVLLSEKKNKVFLFDYKILNLLSTKLVSFGII